MYEKEEKEDDSPSHTAWSTYKTDRQAFATTVALKRYLPRHRGYELVGWLSEAEILQLLLRCWLSTV
jgi:hypothetical protein